MLSVREGPEEWNTHMCETYLVEVEQTKNITNNKIPGSGGRSYGRGILISGQTKEETIGVPDGVMDMCHL